jgi:hypothetical protein
MPFAEAWPPVVYISTLNFKCTNTKGISNVFIYRKNFTQRDKGYEVHEER